MMGDDPDATLPPTRRPPPDAAPAPTDAETLSAMLASPPPSDAEALAAVLASPPAPTPPAPSLPAPPATPAWRPAPAMSPLARLVAEPGRFDLDQASFVIAPGKDPVTLPYRTVARLGLPLSEVAAADPATGELTAPTFGLIGPGGTLPRHYTATTGAELRKRSRALQAFFDMLARRFTGMWVRAGSKYRPARDPVPAERALDAAIGLHTPGLDGRLAVPAAALRYHAGHLAARTRSVERLRAMLAEEAGSEVTIEEFAGGWLRLPATEQSRMGRAFAALGVDAAAGAQVWDPQARFIIRLGPMDAAAFAGLLPGRPLFARLCDLTRLFVGPEQEFVLNPILSPSSVPATILGGAGAGRLGLTSWMGCSTPRRSPATDAYLRPPPM
ncbi:type VI secretion system baseplate subunit TssG [Humitalea sp. 24SJ18S-53]|uniref:type VI secretion system baseplate subunit TssG n=1 Tax=Humitalea sp. 24SJ18S-53 TaxID=3422307 RepID=UPI003D67465A